MNTEPSTTDVTELRLKIVEDVKFVPLLANRKWFYQIERPSQGLYFRVGHPEYVFISLLDGKRSFAEAFALTVRALGAQSLSQQQAQETTLWLMSNQLVESSDRKELPAASLLQFQPIQNPFSIKFLLGSPDRFVSWLHRKAGWCYAPCWTVPSLIFIILSFVSLVDSWDRFQENAEQIFAPSNWIALLATWFMLKVIHELAHALSCKRYGGRIGNAGIVLFLLAPMAFVDVSSSWKEPSRWKRAFVAAAGMHAELFVASMAILLWHQTESPWLAQGLCNLIIMASATTLLFNLNPLMRFDGYFILIDLLGAPNLFERASKRSKQFLDGILFGVSLRQSKQYSTDDIGLLLYGFAIGIWRIVLTCSLLVASSFLLGGWGILLTGLGIVAWFVRPLIKISGDLTDRFNERPLSVFRAAGLSGMFASLTLLLVGVIPLPGRLTVPAVVDYSDGCVVRALSGGFVRSVVVVDGESVCKDQLLVVLENPELEEELIGLETSIEQSRTLHRESLGKHKPAEAQIILRNLQALEAKQAKLLQQQQSLSIRAPLAGKVVCRSLNSQLGTFVKEGAELLVVGDESEKELKLSISHQHARDLPQLFDSPVRFRVGFQTYSVGRIQQIVPRATEDLPHPALSALAGGPLAVRNVSANESANAEPRLVEPRFKLTVSILPDAGEQLCAGQRGTAYLGWQYRTLLARWWVSITEWWHQPYSDDSLESP